jgi:UDP-N-acetylmuramoyl-L-alanyl-D-glutamate--2,6-diaminopimelate ligase
MGLTLTGLGKRHNLKALGGRARVTGLTEDSRLVRPGDIFAAIQGLGHNGRDYIESAKQNGAAAILLETPDLAVGPRLLYDNPAGFRQLVNRVAREIYDYPDQKLDLIGVTGTNGKSTICYLLDEILTLHDFKMGIIGTINYRWPGEVRPAPNTTPEGALLSQTLADMVKAQCQKAVMEVSSHALELGRLEGVKFGWALFTNLTQDHLDFHGDLENYYQAKKKLFVDHLKRDQKVRGAVGTDDPYGLRLQKELGPRVFAFGLNGEPEVKGSNLVCSIKGLSLKITSPFGIWEQKSPLIGSFNALNILGAATIAGLLTVPARVISEALFHARGAPGRLEVVPSLDDTLVLVDYAHTPGALETVLKSLRELKPERVITVFGCGGDRDRLKRPLMGEAAGRLSDIVILTSDNPRTEDPLDIINEAKIGLERIEVPKISKDDINNRQNGYLVEVDRREAIFLAASILKKGDILLIAGKGHEDYQIINRDKWPFDDRVVARQALREASQNRLS